MAKIKAIIHENELELNGVEIIDPRDPNLSDTRKKFAEVLFNKRQRKGMTFNAARSLMAHRNYYAPHDARNRHGRRHGFRFNAQLSRNHSAGLAGDW